VELSSVFDSINLPISGDVKPDYRKSLALKDEEIPDMPRFESEVKKP